MIARTCSLLLCCMLATTAFIVAERSHRDNSRLAPNMVVAASGSNSRAIECFAQARQVVHHASGRNAACISPVARIVLSFRARPGVHWRNPVINHQNVLKIVRVRHWSHGNLRVVLRAKSVGRADLMVEMDTGSTGSAPLPYWSEQFRVSAADRVQSF